MSNFLFSIDYMFHSICFVESYLIEQKKKVGERVQQIREALNLTQAQFASLIGLSVNTIVNIESGEGFNSNTLFIISLYTEVPNNILTDFNSGSIKKDVLIRTFWENVKSINKKAFNKFNSKNIQIKEIIKELADKTPFFESPRKTKDVVDQIKTQYNIVATSPIVSQALLNSVDKGILKKTKLGSRNFQYYK